MNRRKQRRLRLAEAGLTVSEINRLEELAAASRVPVEHVLANGIKLQLAIWRGDARVKWTYEYEDAV